MREGVPTAADKGSAEEKVPLRQELKHGGHNLRRHLHLSILAYKNSKLKPKEYVSSSL